MTLASPGAREQSVQGAPSLFARGAGLDSESCSGACNQVPGSEVSRCLAPVLGVLSEELLSLSQGQLAADATHLAEDGVQLGMPGGSG